MISVKFMYMKRYIASLLIISLVLSNICAMSRDESLSTYLIPPSLRETTNQPADDALNDFSMLCRQLVNAAPSEEELSPEQCEAVRQTRMLADYVTEHANTLRATIMYAEHTRSEDMPSFTVLVSYLQWAVQHLQTRNPRIAVSSMLDYAFIQVHAVCDTYLNLKDMQSISPAPAPLSINQQLRNRQQSHHSAQRIRQAFGYCLSALQIIGLGCIGLPVLIISSIAMLCMMVLSKRLKTAFLQAAMSRLKFKQLPGTPSSLLEKILSPTIVKLKGLNYGPDETNQCVVTLRAYAHYDYRNDTVESSETPKTRFIMPDQYDLARFRSYRAHYNITMPSFRLPAVDKYQSVPSLLHVNGKVMIPVHVSAGELYYDQQGNVFIRSNEHNGEIVDLEIEFVVCNPELYDNQTGAGNVTVQMLLNQDFFRQPPSRLDEEVLQSDLDLGENINNFIDQLLRAPMTTAKRVRAVQNFLLREFGYAADITTQIRFLCS
jgi:hypothetical protein